MVNGTQVTKKEFISVAEHLRFDLALTYKVFADAMGVNMHAYMKWVKGTNEPTFLSLGRMIKYMKSMELDVDVVC